MNMCDIGSDGKTPLQRLHWAKGQHTDPGIWREDFVHAGQASKRRKVGTALPSWSVLFACCTRRQRQRLSPSKGYRSRHA